MRNANAQTRATQRWQEKVGYIVKSFKIKKDVAHNFEQACKYRGITQASAITELMQNFSEMAFIEAGVTIE